MISSFAMAGVRAARLLTKFIFHFLLDRMTYRVHRFYASFSEAAMESGMSRIYGGIHFMSANINGLKSGAAVGHYVATRLLLLKGNRSRN